MLELYKHVVRSADCRNDELKFKFSIGWSKNVIGQLMRTNFQEVCNTAKLICVNRLVFVSRDLIVSSKKLSICFA